MFKFIKSRSLCLLYFFLLTNFILRIVLAIKEFSSIDWTVIPAILFGTDSDMSAVLYVIPFVLIFSFFNFSSKILQTAVFLIVTFFCILFAACEYFFWEEFACRFNFIAVDYLLYTTEVIGNIRESYNMPLLIFSVLAASSVVTFFLNKIQYTKKTTWKELLLVTIFSVLSFHSEFSNNCVNEIPKNGLYELFSAYRNNDLPFEKFYITKDQRELTKHLRKTISADEPNTVFQNDTDITREIKCSAPEKHLNVIIIMVESLGAKFLKHFGNMENITPNLDALIEKSMSFSKIMATGTRTVYGLSGVSLASPPLPGNSIVRRPNNENLSTLGQILGAKGYDCKFLYGGFGYFDNMNYFFENNGHKAIDRSNISKDEITFSNIWGVCDEDLLNKTLKECDASYKNGKPFFSFVMTTSNHRPYTYSEGRIDIPSKTGRSGSVKYTDYAIGEFIKNAQTKRWFKDTVFVITADHSTGGSRKISIDPGNYHIPLIIYSPNNIKPMKIEKLASQIDIAPTILAILNINYTSKFFGHDIVSAKNERAFISNFQQIGYMTNSDLVVLKPIKEVCFYKKNGYGFVKTSDKNNQLLEEALSCYQSATNWQTWSKA